MAIAAQQEPLRSRTHKYKRPNAAAFSALFTIFPRPVWIVSLLVVAGHLCWAAARGDETQARMSLVASASVSLMWSVAFLLMIHGRDIDALGLPILLLSLAAKDALVVSTPLHSPRTTAAEAL